MAESYATGPHPSTRNGHVGSNQRFRGDRRCPICNGAENDPRGNGQRCIGFLSEDGQWCHCSRDEHAGQAPFNAASQCYVHKLKGPCKCGVEHGPADPPARWNGKAKGKGGRIVATYDYPSADGALLFQVVKYDPKAFVQRRPSGKGGWFWDLKGIEPVPYRLPELLAASPADVVLIVEGEKDVDRARALGFTATCNAMGAGKWRDEYAERLRNRHVVIIPDNDQVGRDHAATVARSVFPVAASVKLLELPGLAEGGDLSDWLDAGGTAEVLGHLIYRTPRWEPSSKPSTESSSTRESREDDWVESGEIATLGDVRRAIGEFKYTWKGWIQPGSITTLAADAGTGKTLISLKLCEIVWKHLPWPDGTENTLPAGRPSMWLCYDRAWHGIMRAAGKLGLPDEAILLPTSKGKPLWIPDLDDPRTIDLLERLIRKHEPWALFIDTMTYATGGNMAKAHEAKLAYSPLMGVMAETGCSCLSSTHLSADGKVLNRRPTELSRIVLKLKAPDPENHKRLRFWVDKTDDEKPPPLGVTIGGDAFVAFDDAPPADDDGPKARGPQPEKSSGFAEWLFRYLEPGPSMLAAIIDAARDAKLLRAPDAKHPKPSLSPLYNAKERIPRIFSGWKVREFSARSPGGKELKHWERSRETDEDDEDSALAF